MKTAFLNGSKKYLVVKNFLCFSIKSSGPIKKNPCSENRRIVSYMGHFQDLIFTPTFKARLQVFRKNMKSFLQIFTNIFGRTLRSKVIDEILIMYDDK